MNPQIGKPYQAAFTMMELILVLGLIALFAFLIYSGVAGPKEKEMARRALCMSNQRQILLDLNIFASLHGDELPSTVSVTNGGAMEPMTDGNVMPCYLTFTNSLRNPSTFICPSAKSRTPAQPGQSPASTNVSYFISLDATLKNSPVTTILTGDRHLESNGKPVAPGIFALSTNSSLGWTTEFHFLKGQGTRGVVGFVDGHVEATKNLAGVVARQSMATNRVVVP